MIQKSSVMLNLHSLQMSFSNTWKYGILALAILLLLVALTILTCQMCQLQKRNRAGKSKYSATVLSIHWEPAFLLPFPLNNHLPPWIKYRS